MQHAWIREHTWRACMRSLLGPWPHLPALVASRALQRLAGIAAGESEAPHAEGHQVIDDTSCCDLWCNGDFYLNHITC